MMKKRLWISAVLLGLAALFSVGSLAYFTMSQDTHNRITSGSLDIILHNTGITGSAPDELPGGIVPGVVVDQTVTVENGGSSQVYVRVQYSVVLTDANGAKKAAPEEVNLVVNSADWTYKDGWYYYNHVLPVGATTTPSLQQVELITKTYNPYMLSSFNVDVTAEAVQVVNNTASALTASGWPAA